MTLPNMSEVQVLTDQPWLPEPQPQIPGCLNWPVREAIEFTLRLTTMEHEGKRYPALVARFDPHLTNWESWITFTDDPDRDPPREHIGNLVIIWRSRSRGWLANSAEHLRADNHEREWTMWAMAGGDSRIIPDDLDTTAPVGFVLCGPMRAVPHSVPEQRFRTEVRWFNINTLEPWSGDVPEPPADPPEEPEIPEQPEEDPCLDHRVALAVIQSQFQLRVIDPLKTRKGKIGKRKAKSIQAAAEEINEWIDQLIEEMKGGADGPTNGTDH